jgi:hypothetical protein
MRRSSFHLISFSSVSSHERRVRWKREDTKKSDTCCILEIFAQKQRTTRAKPVSGNVRSKNVSNVESLWTHGTFPYHHFFLSVLSFLFTRRTFSVFTTISDDEFTIVCNRQLTCLMKNRLTLFELIGKALQKLFRGRTELGWSLFDVY